MPQPVLTERAGATMASASEDGRVLLFATVDHDTAEASTHVASRGARFAALEPVYEALIDRFGELEADIARGISLRHDWGPQYRSSHFTSSIRWLGLDDSPVDVGEARDQRVRRTGHPHPQGAVPVSGDLGHHRPAVPGRRRVHAPVQHRMAHLSARPPCPTRSSNRRDDLTPSRLMGNSCPRNRVPFACGQLARVGAGQFTRPRIE